MRRSHATLLFAAIFLSFSTLIVFSFYLGTVVHELGDKEGASIAQMRWGDAFIKVLRQAPTTNVPSRKTTKHNPEGIHNLANFEKKPINTEKQENNGEIKVRSHDDVQPIRNNDKQPPGMIDAKHLSELRPLELKIAQKMKYWRHETTISRPSLWPKVDENKYLVFQTWRGGFNNERMSLELAIVFAICLGRVLVLPPMFDMYLLEPSHLGDYFSMEGLVTLHPTIMFEEWLEKIGIEPPEHKMIPLEEHRHPIWNEIKSRNDIFFWQDTDPTAKNCWIFPRLPKTSLEQQLTDLWCLPEAKHVDLGNNQTLSTPQTVFIPLRKLFDHYFTHFWFVEEQQMKEMLRAVRDHVHYVDRVVDIAAKIIARLPPLYNAMHVRRNDFQYTEIREMPPDKIIENSDAVIPKSEPLWLATDNFTSGFSDPWRRKYVSVHQLSDFKELLEEERVPKIWMGLLDQLILTQAKIFVGTRLSTFSAFAVRMRGFMGMENVETYFTTDNTEENVQREKEMGVEGHEANPMLPTWRKQWGWATWGRDFKEPFEFCGYNCLKRGQTSP